MKLSIYIFLLAIVLIACNTTKPIPKGDNETAKISETPSDSTEYELLVFDGKFDTFLAMQPSKEFYSNEYYRNWNIQYVSEWNARHRNPLKYGNFYETLIDYETNIDYGIDLNHQLYNYFLFIEKEYGITLLRRAKTAR